MLRWTWVKPDEKWPNRKSRSLTGNGIFIQKLWLQWCTTGQRSGMWLWVSTLHKFESRMSQLFWAEVIFSDLWVRTFLSFLLIISSFLPPHFGFLTFGFSNFFLKVIVNSYFVLTLQFLIRMPGECSLSSEISCPCLFSFKSCLAIHSIPANKIAPSKSSGLQPLR